MKKSFAIFDMDGTLIDSMEVWNRLSDEYLAGLGVPFSRKQLENTNHLTMPETAAVIIRRARLSITPEQVAGDINALMEERYRADIPLKPGAAACLARLQAAGFQMCVASSTTPRLIDLCLRRLGVRDYFQFLLSCEEVGVGKSQPKVYLEAARRMGGVPENTVVFEDLVFAARTAKSAGFSVAGIYDASARDSQEALKQTVDRYILRLDDPELFAWLGV